MNKEKTLHVTEDGFVWKILSQKDAIKLFTFGLFELYILDLENGTEALINSNDEIIEAVSQNKVFAMEVGNITKTMFVSIHDYTAGAVKIVEYDASTVEDVETEVVIPNCSGNAYEWMTMRSLNIEILKN